MAADRDPMGEAVERARMALPNGVYLDPAEMRSVLEAAWLPALQARVAKLERIAFDNAQKLERELCAHISTAEARNAQMERAEHAESALAERDAEIERLQGLIAELRDTELADMACTGSDAPVEDVLGRLFDAVA